MKLKFIAFAVIVIAALGLNMFFTKQIDFKGMSKHSLSGTELIKWKKVSPDLIVENNNNQLYLQETIGSQKAIISSKEDLSGDTIIRFKAMPLSASTSLYIKLYQKMVKVINLILKLQPEM